MAITLGDAFQNWNPDTNLPSTGCTVDGGVLAMLEPNLFRNKVMVPGVTYATDVESLMVDNRFAVAFIRKLDKIKVTMCKSSDNAAFRVVRRRSDGGFIEVKCNDVLKVAEVVNEPIDTARVSGVTADRTALASECYDETKELRYLTYLINGGGSPDATDVGAPASANTVKSTKDTILDNIIDDRSTMRKAGASPDTLIISEDTDAVLLKHLGAHTYFRNASETEVSVFGQVFAGTLFSGAVKVFTSNALGQDNSTLVGDESADAEWDWSNIEYILYDHRTLCIINVARYIGLVDYQSQIHNSTLISILTVCGGHIRNTQKVIAKKFSTSAIVKDPAVLTFGIKDEDGAAVTGATIVLKTGAVIGSGDAITADAVDGTYELVVGAYNYSITKTGYTTLTDTFNIIEAQLEKNVQLDVVLVGA